MIEDDQIRRKRALFRSWHRGAKESDLLLGSFAERHLAEFDTDQLSRYEVLLEQEDADILDWVMRRDDPPAELMSDVMRLLLRFDYTARPA